MTQLLAYLEVRDDCKPSSAAAVDDLSYFLHPASADTSDIDLQPQQHRSAATQTCTQTMAVIRKTDRNTFKNVSV